MRWHKEWGTAHAHVALYKSLNYHKIDNFMKYSAPDSTIEGISSCCRSVGVALAHIKLIKLWEELCVNSQFTFPIFVMVSCSVVGPSQVD